MDPSESWTELSRAIGDNDWQAAGGRADELLGWLRKGGFPPRITGIEPFDRIVTRATCESIAAWEWD